MSSVDLGLRLAGKPLLGFGMAAGRLSRLATPKIGSVPICFCAGTLIETDHGGRPIETLKIGDTVVTFDGGTAPVIWVGRRTIPAAEATATGVSPIRIRAGALEAGVPSRDLLVSPGHCLFLDGVLVEARCLVNGASITQDIAHEAVEYVHLELPRHDVVFSEGAPTETFLDVGNRDRLTPLDHSDLSPRPASAADVEKCAPQIVGGAALIAIQTRLAARCDAIGLGWTADPDLHVVCDGRIVQPEFDGSTYRFALGTDPGDVRIASRSTVPAEREFGHPDDRRLGVAFDAIRLSGASWAMNVDLRHPLLADGFHGLEGDFRWTDGCATLPVASFVTSTEPVTLTLHVRHVYAYRDQPVVSQPVVSQPARRAA